MANLNIKELQSSLSDGIRLSVFFADGSVFTSDGKGIFDLLCIAKTEGALKGAYAADKIVGRAAAFLYCICRPEYLYAETLSEGGKKILEESGITFSYGTLTHAIMNHAGTGICPMDDAVKEAFDPQTAYGLILQRANELRKK